MWNWAQLKRFIVQLKLTWFTDNIGSFIYWGQKSHTKVKGHLRSSSWIAWKCKINHHLWMRVSRAYTFQFGVSAQTVVAAWFIASNHYDIRVCDLSPCGKGNSRLLGGLATKNQEVQYQPPYVRARWLSQQIPPLKFLTVELMWLSKLSYWIVQPCLAKKL